MLNEFKDDLVNAVKETAEILTDEDALAIIEICKRAANREIANVTEECLVDLITGSGSE